MRIWKTWKKGFDKVEKHTGEKLDKALRSPLLLRPSAGLLKAALGAKSKGDKALSLWWKTLGITNRDDQDRAMHRINQLESRILDLEEELHDLRGS